jgi:hypothetical protein
MEVFQREALTDTVRSLEGELKCMREKYATLRSNKNIGHMMGNVDCW